MFYHIQRVHTYTLVVTGVLCSIFCTVAMDATEAFFQHSAFYWSESLLFSSFWLLFLPVLYTQFLLLTYNKTVVWIFALVLFPTIVHLLIYPALVMALSGFLYSHRFQYFQTFQFGLTQQLFKLLFIYCLLPGFHIYLKIWRKPAAPSISPDPTASFITILPVKNAGSQTLLIPVATIQHIAANTPYLDVHLLSGKYLYKGSLKTILLKLDPAQFVQIHKSMLVNLQHVQSYKTRLNGDYDLLLKNRLALRVSRNYAKTFKTSLEKLYQVRT